jgi:hypothetical protein
MKMLFGKIRKKYRERQFVANNLFAVLIARTLYLEQAVTALLFRRQ